MSKTPCILVYGRDHNLLETRRLVLDEANFHVRTVADPSAAAQALIDQQIDLFILCHTLSDEECDAMLTAIHASQPQAKILILSAYTKGYSPKQIASVVNPFDGPRKLISKVKELTSRQIPIKTSSADG